MKPELICNNWTGYCQPMNIIKYIIKCDDIFRQLPLKNDIKIEMFKKYLHYVYSLGTIHDEINAINKKTCINDDEKIKFIDVLKYINYYKIKFYSDDFVLNHRIIIGDFDYVKYVFEKYLFKKLKLKYKRIHNMRYGNYDLKITIAIENGHLNILQFLYENLEKCEIIYNIKLSEEHLFVQSLAEAASKGYIEIVKFLHSKGVNIIYNNNSSIKNAAYSGHLDIVKYLHENGADINDSMSKQYHGYDRLNTPLKLAAHNGHLDIVKYLCENGAHINSNRPYRKSRCPPNTALECAVVRNKFNVVKYLCENGADVTLNKNGAIELALERNNYKILKYLCLYLPDDSKLVTPTAYDSYDKYSRHYCDGDSDETFVECSSDEDEYKMGWEYGE
jgi:ankyrin repeat protein